MKIKVKTENSEIHALIVNLAKKKFNKSFSTLEVRTDSKALSLDTEQLVIDPGYISTVDECWGEEKSLEEVIRLLSPVEKINTFRVLTKTPEMAKTLIDIALRKGYKLGYVQDGTYYLMFNSANEVCSLDKDWYENYKDRGTWLSVDEAIEQLGL